MTKTTGSQKKQTSKSAIATQEKQIEEYSNYLYSVFYNRVKDILSYYDLDNLEKLNKIRVWIEFVEEVKREKQEEFEKCLKNFLKN